MVNSFNKYLWQKSAEWNDKFYKAFLIFNWVSLPVHIFMWALIWLQAYFWIPVYKKVVDNFRQRHERIIEKSPLSKKVTSFECGEWLMQIFCNSRTDFKNEYDLDVYWKSISMILENCDSNCSVDLLYSPKRKDEADKIIKDLVIKLPELEWKIILQEFDENNLGDDINLVKNILEKLWYKWNFTFESIIDFISKKDFNYSSLSEQDKNILIDLYKKSNWILKFVKNYSIIWKDDFKLEFFTSLWLFLPIIVYLFYIRPKFSRQRLIEKLMSMEWKYLTSSYKPPSLKEKFNFSRKVLRLQSFEDFSDFYYKIHSLPVWITINWFTKDELWIWKDSNWNEFSSIFYTYHLEENWIKLSNIDEILTKPQTSLN